MNNGRWMIVGILTLAVTAAGFSWWYRYQQGRRALEFWGSEAAYLIRLAPDVTLYALGESTEQGAGIEVDGQKLSVVSTRQISDARGLVHARAALLHDASFDWNKSPHPTQWEYALRFTDGERSTTVLLDVTGAAARRADRPTVRALTIADGFRRFLEEQFASTPERSPSAAAGGS